MILSIRTKTFKAGWQLQYAICLMETLVPLRQLESIVGFRKSKIYQLIECGQFPRPIKIGRSSRWLSSEVQDWIYKLAKQNQRLEQSLKASVEVR